MNSEKSCWDQIHFLYKALNRSYVKLDISSQWLMGIDSLLAPASSSYLGDYSWWHSHIRSICKDLELLPAADVRVVINHLM